jgi:hypothetical protein
LRVLLSRSPGQAVEGASRFAAGDLDQGTAVSANREEVMRFGWALGADEASALG